MKNIKLYKKIPLKSILVSTSLGVENISTSVEGLTDTPQNIEIVDEDYERDVSEELVELISDYRELSSMGKDTKMVEQEIIGRVFMLKDEMKNYIENCIDIPVKLDGELLVYKDVVKKTEELDESNIEGIPVSIVNGKNYYSYYEKDLYNFDIDEECLMSLIRFINAKKDYTLDELLEVINNYKLSKDINYGYRLELVTMLDEKLDPKVNSETIVYTGTLFNNTKFSLQTMNLVDRIKRKIISDYIDRTNNDGNVDDFELRKVNNHILIVNKINGATDFLDDNETNLCNSLFKVESCFDSDEILFNEINTDNKIRELQIMTEEYIKTKNDTIVK